MLNRRHSQRTTKPDVNAQSAKDVEARPEGTPLEVLLRDPRFMVRLKRLGLWYLRDDPKALAEELQRIESSVRPQGETTERAAG